MATQITFRGWRRPGAASTVTGVQGGRPGGQASLRLDGRDAGGGATGSQTATLPLLLAGPGDVTGLQPGAVSRRFPKPDVNDAEVTKCPFAEFAAPDLPWRYTPAAAQAAGNRRLRPWLVLVVGSDDEMQVAGDQVTIAAAALAAHPLAGSPCWAHVQEGAGAPVARVLSPRPLDPATSYVAALVPAFTVGTGGAVADAWPTPPAGTVLLPLYGHWRFRTGEGGDFRSLAAKLRPGAADPGTGRAPVAYPRVPAAGPLGVRGALAPVGSATTDPPLPPAIATDLGRLRTPPPDPAGRPVVGLPRYGDAWTAKPDDTTWGKALNGDPRRRGVAGLGMRVGVEAQEELAAEATRQAGALDNAAQRVRHLTLGLAATVTLWRRRLPADPTRRLWLLGPALGRVVTPRGPAATLATAADRPLPAGFFSTATRRALRPGPARTALAERAATDPAQLAAAANRCPPPAPFGEHGLPAFDDLGAGDFDRSRKAIARGTAQPSAQTLQGAVSALNLDRFPEFRERVGRLGGLLGQHVTATRPLPWVHTTLLLAALAGGQGDPDFNLPAARKLLVDLTDRFGDLTDEPGTVAELLGDLGDTPEPPPACDPLDLTGLSGELVAAFDPSRPELAPAAEQVLGTVTGLDPAQPLAPPEPCQGIDLPVWRHVAELVPDWLLPGVGQLPADAVIGAETNPAFTDAFLVGLNTRVVEELRWRNIRVAADCTPIRTFWTRTDAATGQRLPDVVGIANWALGSALGDAQHRPPGLPAGADLALVFRSRVFDRYPHTLVYLVTARHGGVVDFTVAPAADAPRTLPSFQGHVGGDVVFFGFQGVPPASLPTLWVVLEEPESGYRFRNDVPAATSATDGAQFANLAFDDPSRVLIQGDHLTPGGAP